MLLESTLELLAQRWSKKSEWTRTQLMDKIYEVAQAVGQAPGALNSLSHPSLVEKLTELARTYADVVEERDGDLTSVNFPLETLAPVDGKLCAGELRERDGEEVEDGDKKAFLFEPLESESGSDAEVSIRLSPRPSPRTSPTRPDPGPIATPHTLPFRRRRSSSTPRTCWRASSASTCFRGRIRGLKASTRGGEAGASGRRAQTPPPRSS